MEEDLLNPKTDVKGKPPVNLTLNGESLDAYSSGSGRRKGSLFSPLLWNIAQNTLENAVRHKKEMKNVRIGAEVKLCLFTRLCVGISIENPKEYRNKSIRVNE